MIAYLKWSITTTGRESKPPFTTIGTLTLSLSRTSTLSSLCNNCVLQEWKDEEAEDVLQNKNKRLRSSYSSDSSTRAGHRCCGFGYHNFFSCVRLTGEVESKGESLLEKRFVTKKWYDRRSGRKRVRREAAVMTNRAPKRGLLASITKHTLKTVVTEAFRLAIIARRDSYAPLRDFYNNKKMKRLKFALRQREQRAIEQLIDYISYGGTKVVVLGDCSKTTGFKSSTP